MYWLMERTKIKEDGLDYIKGNEELVGNVLTELGLIRNHLEMNVFKFRFGD